MNQLAKNESDFPMLLEREYISSFTWLCAEHSVTKSIMLLEKATLFWKLLNCCRTVSKRLYS